MSRRASVGVFRALARYYRDPSRSTLGKLIAVLAVVYVVVPVDLIPDIPIVGWLDDLGVMGLAAAWLRHALSPYRSAVTADQNHTGLRTNELVSGLR